ncbi:MAG: sigma-70 family RNA polymerase sigma factor [Bacteroidota bacterium]
MAGIHVVTFGCRLFHFFNGLEFMIDIAPMTSEILWEEMKSGNEDAFQQIYQEQVKYLYQYGMCITPSQSVVEDCLHDLFVEIWTKRSKLGPTDSIKNYLAGSLRRRIVKQLKSTQKYVPMSGDESSYQTDLNPSIEDQIVHDEQVKERATDLDKAYQSLTTRQREIIYLRYHQGLSYEQISEQLGIQYQSLRNLLSGAIKGMRLAMSSITILALLLVTGCAEESADIGVVDPELATYFDTFKDEAELRGIEIEDFFFEISGVLTDLPNASGQCASGQTRRELRVDQTYWNRVNDTKREFLIFHELGHCYLDLRHDDESDEHGRCLSIMTSGLGSCRSNYNPTTRAAYLDELFSK